MDATTIPGPPPEAPRPPDRARELYRRRQRRRAVIGWSVGFLVVALLVLGAVLGGEEEGSSTPTIRLFSWEMTSLQYEAIHKGESEKAVVRQLGGTGLREAEVQETELLRLFPSPPPGSDCSFWKLSDAPDHLVRLCFRESDGLLVQKAVRAPGETRIENTLV